MLYSLIRWGLFQLPAETSHDVTLNTLAFCHKLGFTALLPKVPSHPVRCFGLSFDNPVGLAAGLDKNGDYIDALATLGFGFIEIGTITPRPQPGNPKPRLFRLPHKMAIINRMGFNNKGVDYLVAQVKKSQYSGILGINIGKNFDTPVEKALDDYLVCLQKIYAVADYVVINVSSPNTQGLRSLQHGDSLSGLLAGLMDSRDALAQTYQKQVPLLLKIAPDLTDEDIQSIARLCLQHRVDGVIATNTTLSRDGVEGLPFAKEQGGLSGGPLFMKSTQVLRKLCVELGGKIPVIGVGGITHRAQALEKVQAGADLVQVYSGFIYQGPGLIRECVQAIANWNRH